MNGVYEHSKLKWEITLSLDLMLEFIGKRKREGEKGAMDPTDWPLG